MKKYSVSHYFGDEDCAIELHYENIDTLAKYIQLFFIGLDGDSSRNAYSLNIGCSDEE
jgi:hypothetical protein